MLIAITVAAFCMTLLGGVFALRLKDRLHLILGFSAGAIVGVAFFDLIPEAIELGLGVYEPAHIMAIVGLGFVAYLLLDRTLLMHGHDEHCEHCEHEGKGTLGAGSLSLHSFLDGIGIGLAFQVSPALGAVVAAAVLTHDFSDGINTVGLILRNGGDKKRAVKWLFADALAPVLGVSATFFFSLPDTALAPLLALFSGFFLYIGASDLLPESHHAHPVLWTTVATVLGMGVMYTVVTLAGL